MDKSVQKHDPINTVRTDGNYNYVGATTTNRTLNMVPGIAKETVGHYAPSEPFIAGTDNISPGETLRFMVKIKNQDDSKGTGVNANDANAGNLRDFTVVDYLPPEYVYKAGSATIGLNAKYLKTTGEQTVAALSTMTLEPTVTPLDDGRTKLTWSFTGKDTRLFNLYYYGATEGYMHVLTYDADWNAAYPKVYGNYTNTATVTHSYDFRSVSTGSPDTAAKSITASTVVNVYGAAGTVAEKKVTNAAGTTVSGQNTINTVPIAAGETVRYTLEVKNAATNATTYAKNLVVIDELPRAAGDTGVVNRTGRDSEFAVLFDATPNIAVSLRSAAGVENTVGTSDYTVRYGMSVGGLNTNGDWSQAETGGRIAWGTDSNNKNAIRIAFAEGFRVPKGDTVIVSFRAVAASGAKPGETAWNSFGYSYRAVTGGETTAKIYAEPRRVGIQVPEATLSVTKALTGNPAPARAEFTFVLKQNGTALPNVRYTLNGFDATFYTLAGGTFKLKAGQTATFHVSPGSGFTVEEATTSAALMPAHFDFASAAAARPGDGTDAAQVFTYKAVAMNETAGAVFTNNYTAPPVIDLTVEKQWAGDADPNRPASVLVQLLGNGTPAGEPVTLNTGNGWAHTWHDLDNAVTWTVAETSVLPDGYTTQVAGDNANGFVITNTYVRPEGRLTVHKTVTGGGDPNTLFTFRFTFSEAARYVCAFSNGGTGTIATGESLRLKRDESVAIILPRGITYTVVEDVYSDYIPTPSDRTFTGTVGVTQSRADYSNRYYTPDPYNPDPYNPGPNPEPYIPVPTGGLQVQKAITGDRADKAAKFPFTVTFSAPGSYAYAGSQSGVIRSGDAVYLGNGDYINIFNLPAGTTYSVTESGNSGYMAYASGAIGVVPANGVATAAFTNTRSSVPKTGDDNALLMGLLLMLVSAMGLLLMAVGMMRLRKKEPRA